MKNNALKIITEYKRKYFISSIFGILSVSFWFFFIERPLKNEDFFFQICIEGMVIGITGVLLMLYSCAAYYFRLGIVPGVYHSTLCIPSWNSGKISFSLSKSLYFCLVSSSSSAVLYFTIYYAILTLGPSFCFTAQLACHWSLPLLVYNNLKKTCKKREIFGLFFIILSGYSIFFNETEEIELVYLGFAALIGFVNLISFFSISQANEFNDKHSTAVLSMIIHGIIAAVGYSVFLVYGTGGNFGYFNLVKGTLFSMFLYCFHKCDCNESAVILAYPCFFIVFDRIWEISSFIVLVGGVSGIVVTIAGDLPCIIYQKCRAENKSELHSPLL